MVNLRTNYICFQFRKSIENQFGLKNQEFNQVKQTTRYILIEI